MQLWPLALLAGLAAGSCGKASDEPSLLLDSNTNWLKRCDADDQCDGSLRCYCGQCSLPCAGGDECSLLAGAECASSGGAVCSEQPGAGGLCVLGCVSDQECGLDFACTAGQCVPQPCTGAFLGADDLYQELATDVSRLDAGDAPTTRYITLANHSSYHACESTLLAQSQGLSKLLNSLSLSSLVTAPQPVDAAEVVYRIDLRDYEWDRPVVVRGVTYPDVWEALISLDPYAVPMIGDDADDTVSDTQTLVPLVFASSLIASALDPELYAAVLDLPEQIDPFYSSLGVIAPDARAGFTLTRETIASHFQMQSRVGFVWQIWALRTEGTLFDAPLGTPDGDREIVFSLPNGLSGFFYADRFGARLESSPDFIDPTQLDFRARAPLSGLRLHPTGLSLAADEVRDNVEANPGRFEAEDLAAIRAAYPGAEAIATLVQQEAEFFTRRALAAANVDPALPEPISTVMDDFNRDVDLDTAAGELLVTREFLEENLNLLPPELSVLDGGQISRSDFSELYLAARCVLSAVQENTPDPDICP